MQAQDGGPAGRVSSARARLVQPDGGRAEGGRAPPTLHGGHDAQERAEGQGATLEKEAKPGGSPWKMEEGEVQAEGAGGPGNLGVLGSDVRPTERAQAGWASHCPRGLARRDEEVPAMLPPRGR